MDKYINRDLDARYNTLRAENKSKTIIDLALSGYKPERDAKAGGNGDQIDATFRAYARSQLKVFIFAGHDASATSICYAWLLLSRNPAVMAKLRAEHDAILGPDSSTASAKLIESPQLINRLPHTLAVIKETLRLFPVVSAPRKGNENCSLRLLKASASQPNTASCGPSTTAFTTTHFSGRASRSSFPSVS
jgi:hypothetical protein